MKKLIAMLLMIIFCAGVCFTLGACDNENRKAAAFEFANANVEGHEVFFSTEEHT